MELEFDKVAGRGLFGEVWRATDLLDRALAVKFIMGADAFEERLARSHAAALARVRHPRVVHLLALESHLHPETGETHLAIIMEFIPGTCLSQVTELPYAHARRVAFDIIDALQAIHEAGIIHGDLHDGNVIVGDGRGTVIDMLYTRSLADIRTTMAARDRDQDYRDLVQLLRIVFDKAEIHIQAVENFIAEALVPPRSLERLRLTLETQFPPDDMIPLDDAQAAESEAKAGADVHVASPPVAPTIYLEDYEKDGQIRSFLVKGNTFELRGGLKELGGRWIRSLGGWVFPKKKQPIVEEFIAKNS